MKRPKLFGLHADPPQALRWCLASIPFIVVVVLYLVASDARLDANPQDKLLPSIRQMVSTVQQYAFTEDRRTGEYLLWEDTFASLTRLGVGIFSATVIALLIGLNMGMFSGAAAGFSPFITFVSMVPPLAVLPILFISLGVGELGKIALIFIGTFPLITRDIYLSVKKVPSEQVVKALTLGASDLAVVYRVVLPQMMPKLIDSVRLSLGAAWLFLIAAEAIASSEGLGYRIFLVRRYLAMDAILPYVMWITLLGFLFDWLLRRIQAWLYPWYRSE